MTSSEIRIIDDTVWVHGDEVWRCPKLGLRAFISDPLSKEGKSWVVRPEEPILGWPIIPVHSMELAVKVLFVFMTLPPEWTVLMDGVHRRVTSLRRHAIDQFRQERGLS